MSTKWTFVRVVYTKHSKQRKAKKKSPCSGREPGSVVMTFASGDIDVVVIAAVDETVFLGDASAPISGEVVAQGFGLADSFVTIPLDVGEERVHLAGELAVFFDPFHEVIPCGAREDSIHGAAFPSPQKIL